MSEEILDGLIHVENVILEKYADFVAPELIT